MPSRPSNASGRLWPSDREEYRRRQTDREVATWTNLTLSNWRRRLGSRLSHGFLSPRELTWRRLSLLCRSRTFRVPMRAPCGAEMLHSRPCLASAASSIHALSATFSPPSSSSPASCSSFPVAPSRLRTRRFCSFRPLSSLRETKKQTLQKIPNAPQNLKFESSSKRNGEDGVPPEGEEEGEVLGGDGAVKGTVLAGLLLLGVVGGFGAVGYVYKDQINAFLTQFSGFIEGPSK